MIEIGGGLWDGIAGGGGLKGMCSGFAVWLWWATFIWVRRFGLWRSCVGNRANKVAKGDDIRCRRSSSEWETKESFVGYLVIKKMRLVGRTVGGSVCGGDDGRICWRLFPVFLARDFCPLMGGGAERFVHEKFFFFVFNVGSEEKIGLFGLEEGSNSLKGAFLECIRNRNIVHPMNMIGLPDDFVTG